MRRCERSWRRTLGQFALAVAVRGNFVYLYSWLFQEKSNNKKIISLTKEVFIIEKFAFVYLPDIRSSVVERGRVHVAE